MTINSFWWWGFTLGELGNVENLFIVIPLVFTLTRSGSVYWGAMYRLKALFNILKGCKKTTHVKMNYHCCMLILQTICGPKMRAGSFNVFQIEYLQILYMYEQALNNLQVLIWHNPINQPTDSWELNVQWRYRIYPTPPPEQNMTQSQFFKRSLTGLNSEFSFS